MLIYSSKSNKKNQVKSQESAQQKHFQCPEDAKRVISCLAPGERSILNSTCCFMQKFQHIYPRQRTIARYTGLSRKHVNRTLAKFQSLGLLTIERVDTGACYYRLAPFFYKRLYQFALVGILPALMGVWFLTSRIQIPKKKQSNHFLEEVTPYYKINTTKQEQETIKRTNEEEVYPFWDGFEDLGLEKDAELMGELCDPDRPCIVCEREEELVELLEEMRRSPHPSEEHADTEDTQMSAWPPKAKKQETAHTVTYTKNEPYATLEQEVDWLLKKALEEARTLACAKEVCQNNLKGCAPARNNPYRLALDEIQKAHYDKTYIRKTWQQIALGNWGKVFICHQKDSDEQ